MVTPEGEKPKEEEERRHHLDIYTTKIDGVVCPQNISETVAVTTVKLAHRPRIASTTIKFISKPIVLSILEIILKTIQPIGADAKRKPSPPQIRLTPFPVSVTHPRVRVKCCRYILHVAITQSGWPRPESRVRVKQFSQS